LFKTTNNEDKIMMPSAEYDKVLMNHAKDQAKSQLESILEMVAIQTIYDDPLSVQVRSGWADSKEDFEPEEFAILLCTGGPAVRLIGELDNGEPTSVRVQFQDWFTPWEDYPITSEEEEKVLVYCRHFYFGE